MSYVMVAPACGFSMGSVMEYKKCSKCGDYKKSSKFQKRRESSDGLRGECMSCLSDRKKEQMRRYRQKTENRVRQNNYLSMRWKTDPAFRLTSRTRHAARRAMRGVNVKGFFLSMPYSASEFVDHLLASAPQGFSREELVDGSKFHIDHIKPVCSFNLTGDIDSQFRECWALSNLRLVSAKTNFAKSIHYRENHTDGR